ncbi:LysR family transcriptional regulator [Rheinheimera sp.]|uniref:LysR family transcriptional regulator n=1 Tax=Rheinheimera sp. TaxID=1869214 RepID=UPI0037C5FD04
MNYPSPRQWLLLDAICRYHSLSEAAQQQALSQPAASQALKELEQRLGATLFLRQNRQLVPTQYTLDLLPRLRQLLDLQASIVQPQSDSGELRLVASETIGCYLLPPLMAKFRQQYTGAEIRLQICNSSEVQNQLRLQQAQLGFIEGPVLSTEFLLQYWRKDTLVLVASADNGLPDDASQLQQQTWIVRERGSGTRAVLEHELARCGWSPAKIMELQRPEAIKQAVRHGLGIGCLPLLAVQDELAQGVLRQLPSPLKLERQLSLLQHQQYQAPLVQQFIRFLHQAGVE